MIPGRAHFLTTLQAAECLPGNSYQNGLIVRKLLLADNKTMKESALNLRPCVCENAGISIHNYTTAITQ